MNRFEKFLVQKMLLCTSPVKGSRCILKNQKVIFFWKKVVFSCNWPISHTQEFDFFLLMKTFLLWLFYEFWTRA